MLRCVIVTGGAGFIGSATLEVLDKARHRLGIEKLVAVDNLYSGSVENIRHLIDESRIEFVRLDISRYNDLGELVQSLTEFRSEIGIVHLAALVNIVEVYEMPHRALEVNVLGTLNVLELARKLDAHRIVYASSVAVYGEPQYLPIDEDHPLRPANLYGLTKFMGEQILWRYGEDYGLSVIALRYFNVYGPRMRRGPYAGVVYRFIEALMSSEAPIIFGDGEQTRDFVYVYDVAEANLKALESDYIGAVNIGSGIEISVNRLYRIVCSAIGKCPKPRNAPPRKGDVRRSRASIDRAKQVLGWEPSVGIEEGIARTIEWYRSRL